jgi:hypothetical protein
MEADGLDAVTIHPSLVGESADGQVVFELFELTGDPAEARPLFRQVLDVRGVTAGRSYTWRFQPIDGSRGRRYLVEIGLPGTSFGRGISLLATRDEHYAQGRFWFDGREQWGDLVFSTGASRATSFSRFEHALRDKPAWLRSRWTLGALLALYNLALALVLWTVLTGPDEPGDGVEPATASPIPQRWRWALASVFLVAAGAAYFWLVPQPFRRERGAIDLLARFPEATKRTTMVALNDGFHYAEVTYASRRFTCIVALPPSRITWTVDVPPNAELRGFAGMRPDTWTVVSDGALLRVGVSDGATYEQAVRRYFQPAADPADRLIAPFSMDLSKYAGRRVDVIFNTEPGEMNNAVGDAAIWCEPRIVRRDR